MLDGILQWDRDTFIYLNSLGIEQYDVFWSTVTRITLWIPLFLIFIILFFRTFPKREAWYMILSVLALLLFIITITDLTKEVVARLRPNNDADINTLVRILQSPTDYSFFSGHASVSFAMTTLIFLFLRERLRWAWLFYLWPLLFSFSRIYVGVHFPIDIMVGACVGLFSGWLFHSLHQRLISPYLR
jgi:undecaprenyl-diphosphatase